MLRKVKPEEMNKWRNKKYYHMMNSKDYLAQLEAMINHDIYQSANIESDSISTLVKAEALIIVALQDHLVNPVSSIEFARKLDYTIIELTGNCGHTAVWCEADIIRDATSSFLK